MNVSGVALLSPRELARQSGWSESRIRRLIARNEIRHVRIGASIYAPEDALEEFLNLNMVVPQSPLHPVSSSVHGGEEEMSQNGVAKVSVGGGL
jgi:excisionase family DNA binding protein